MNVFLSKIGGATGVKIPSGQQISNTISAKEATYDAEAITIIAPPALDAGTYTIQLNDTLDGTGSNWSTLQDETATDYKFPAAGKAIVYSIPAWTAWRIFCSVAAGADRVFQVYKLSRADC